MMDNKIYKIERGHAMLWIASPLLQNPNGLFAEKDRLVLASKGGRMMKFISLRTKRILNWAKIEGNPDGVVSTLDGNHIISSWNGQVFFVGPKGRVQKFLDTTNKKINSADIEYIVSKKMLLVPTFFDDQVVAYKVTY